MKKLISSFTQGMLLIAFTLVLTGCDELLYLKDNPVTPRLRVKSNSITVKVGETSSCEASTQDHVALFYASADPAVATVDTKGTITGVAVGKTKITVTAKGDDDYYRTQIFGESTQVIDVEVVEAKTKINVESVTLDQPTLDKKVGDAAVTLTATVNPSDADDKTVTWKSSDETVATVADGVVTFVAAGTATITATATNGTDDTADDKTATCVVTITAPSMLSTPLTLEAITAGTIVVKNPQAGMQYSLNGGAKQAVTTDAITVAVGDKVQFYGDGTSITAYYSYDGNNDNDTKITGGTAQVKVYGNIMSLVNETGYETGTELTGEFAFGRLFNGNTTLTDISDLQLPATNLTRGCYQNLFQGCTGLTTVPEKLLPATTLANQCYQSMFQGCTGLTTVPEKLLPATTLKDNCYQSMFQGCTGLTTVPEKLLPATTLAQGCYISMFWDCTGLTTLPEKLLPATVMKPNCYGTMFYRCTGLTTVPEKLLPAETLANNCYQNMFQGCTSLTTAPALPATNLANNCYIMMFYDCASLTTTPKLPATTLAQGCYSSMFENCTGLTTAYVKAAYTNANDECDRMFNGCTATGAKLHTAAGNQISWLSYLGGNWNVAIDY